MSVRTLRRANAARLARWGLMCLEDRVTPAVNVWTGNAGTSNWADDNNWDLLHRPTLDDDAYINTAVTVTHASGTDTVKSLNLAGNAILNLTGGSLAVTGNIEAPAAASDLVLAGGSLVGGTVTTGSEVIATNASGVLSGITLAGTLNMAAATNTQAAVTGGLTLSGGTILLGSPGGNYGYLGFDGTQTLGGTGTVVFGTNFFNFLQAGPTAGSRLTIGPNVTVRGHTGGVGYHPSFGGSANVAFTNQGTIRADMAGGTVALNGTNWTNTGTATAAGGTLSTGGSWTNSGTLKSAGDAAAIAASPGGATQSGTTVTITTAAAHGFTVGQSVVVSGVGVGGFNGTFTVTAVATPTTFTYTAATGLADSGGGTVTLNSALNLGGTFATPTLGTVASTGGVVNLTGTLTNSGNTLTLDAATGPWRLAGGTIDGGTVATGGGVKLVGTTFGGTLANGVTLAGTLDLTGASGTGVRATGGLTLNNGTLLIGGTANSFGSFSFDGGAQTLGGTGTVVFGNSFFNFLQAGPTANSALTIGPGVTVTGHTGNIGFHTGYAGPTNVTFTNQGTIRSDVPGGAITLDGTNWANTGTVRASGGGNLNLIAVVAAGGGWSSSTPVEVIGGGTLTLRGNHWTTAGVTLTGSTLNLGGTFTQAGLGTLTRTGGTVNVTGTLDNTNQTLALDAATGSWRVDQGTILGGTVTTADGTALVATPVRTTLTGVTLAGTLDAAAEQANVQVVGGLTLAGGTVLLGSADGARYSVLQFADPDAALTGTGTVVFGRNYYNWVAPGILPDSHLTIGPDVTVRGHTGGVGYHAGWGGNPTVSVTLQGTVQADVPGASITVDNLTNYANGTLTGGTFKALDAVLRLPDGPVTTTAANLVLDGPNARIFYHVSDPTDALGGLRSVSPGGALTVNGAALTVGGPMTNAGAVTVGPGGALSVRHQYAGSVVGFSSQWSTAGFSAAQSLGPPNVFAYGDNPNAWIPLAPDAGAEFLTVGFATPDFADGVVVRETNLPGFVTKVEAIDEADVAHTVWTGTDTSPPNQVSDFVITWPRTAYRVKAVKVSINSALKPGWEAIDAIQMIGANTGYAQAGGTTTVAAGGSLTLTPGTAYAQAAGTTVVNGTLSATVPVAINGGRLEGTGTVAADLTNTGTVNPGPGLGTLTVTGDYTQTAAGTLEVEVGGTTPGTQYDRLAVGGSAALDGNLTVGLANGFFPAVGDTFSILDLGTGSTGGTTFVSPPAATFDIGGPTTVKLNYAGGTGNDVTLTAINRAPTLNPIPDPPSTLENPGLQTIDLTGIGSGNVEAQGLTVTAVSDNPTLIPNPTVNYTSPNATGTLTYTPTANRNGTATVTVTVTDSGGTANGGVNFITRTFVVTVVELNDAPTLDPIIPNPVHIVEDAAAQTINLSGITAGGGETQTLTVTATSSDPFLIPNPVVTYTSADPTGSLTFTPAPNRNGSVVITVTVKDSGGTAFGGIDEVTRSFIVDVDSVPDAPSIDPDPLTMLDPVPVRTKPTVEPAGTLVSDLLTNPTDADGDPVGIAITGLDPANTVNAKAVPKYGVWQFSTDGVNWSPIPRDVSPAAALVLSADATTRVRFLPNLRFQGLSHFTFRAWDHSDTAIPGSQVDTTILPTAYGAASERAWVAVGKSKPPVDAAGATLLAAVKEDAKASKTFPVKSLLGLAGLEALPATGLGLAITGHTTTTGTWEYRLAKAKDFLPLAPVDPLSRTNALLLRPTDSLRFVPAANATGTGGLTFKTWVPDAAFGTYADTTGFAVNSGAATIPIAAVNDAPVVNPAIRADLGTLAAGGTSAEMTVATLLAMAPGLATDVDTAALGIQLFPASTKVGKWQYFDGATWQDVKGAKLLAADVQVRFQAAAGAAAGTYTLGFKVWDGKLLSKLRGEATLTVG